MVDEGSGPVTISEAAPDFEMKYGRVQTLGFEARRCNRNGAGLAPELAAEADALLRWADAVSAKVCGDVDGFRQRRIQDRATGSLALRLSGDEQRIRQLLDACDELRDLLR